MQSSIRFAFFFIAFSLFLSHISAQAPGIEVSQGEYIFMGGRGTIEITDPLNNSGEPDQNLLIDIYDIQTTIPDTNLRCGILYIQDGGGDLSLASEGSRISVRGKTVFQDSIALGGSVQVRASGQIAFGTINSDGDIDHGSDNFNSTWNDTLKRYEISISDENYLFRNYTTTATPIGTNPVLISTSSVSGKLLIHIHNLNSEKIQSPFSFVVNKNIQYDGSWYSPCDDEDFSGPPTIIKPENPAKKKASRR